MDFVEKIFINFWINYEQTQKVNESHSQSNFLSLNLTVLLLLKKPDLLKLISLNRMWNVYVNQSQKKHQHEWS